MSRRRFPILVAALAATATASGTATASAEDGPVTDPGTDSAPLDTTSTDRAWTGTAALVARVPRDGRGSGTGPPDFADESWGWRAGYDAFAEPSPDLVLRARRRADGARFTETWASNARFGDGEDLMPSRLVFPGPGCWEVTGTDEGTETLAFTLLVGPSPAAEDRDGTDGGGR